MAAAPQKPTPERRGSLPFGEGWGGVSWGLSALRIMKRLKLHIGTKILVWFLLVNAVSVVSMVSLVYQDMRGKLLVDKFEQLAAIRDLVKLGLLTNIAEHREIAATIAHTPLITDVLRDNSDTGRASGYLRDILLIYNHGHAIEEFAFLHIVDSTGTIVASTDETQIGTNIAARHDVQDALRGFTGFAGPYFSTTFPEQRHVTAYAPVVHAGRVIGAILAPSPLEHFSGTLVSEEVRIGESGESYIVGLTDDAERDAMQPDSYKRMITTSRFLETRPDITVDTDAVNACINGNSGTTIIEDYRGISVLSAYAPLGVMDWAILSEIDEAEVLSALNEVRKTLFLFGAASLLVVGLISVWIARTITSPIHELHVGSEKIGAGNLDYALNIRTGDEIEQLADEFNRMSAKLKESRAELVGNALESGRAQMAAMVMHNVGNAITPMQIHIEDMQAGVSDHIAGYLEKCYADLRDHRDELGHYITVNPRGKEIFSYLGELIHSLRDHDEQHSGSLHKIREALTYIAESLSLQQTYAISGEEHAIPLDVNALLDDAIRIQQGALEKRAITVEKKYTPHLPALRINRNKLMQVFVNFIKNSYEAIDESQNGQTTKMITLTSSTRNNRVWIDITDTGMGIAEENLDKIFKFGHSHKGSSGFGLHYCKMFVESNDGTISISSPGKGKGATVTISFPVDLSLGINPQSQS